MDDDSPEFYEVCEKFTRILLDAQRKRRLEMLKLQIVFQNPTVLMTPLSEDAIKSKERVNWVDEGF